MKEEFLELCLKLNISKRISFKVSEKLESLVNASNDSIAFETHNNKKFKYLELVFKSEKHLPIKIFICENELNVFIGKSNSLFWEDFEIEEENKDMFFEEGLNMLFNFSIKEIIYNSGNIEFMNTKKDEIFFSSKKLFSFLYPKKKSKDYTYTPWSFNSEPDGADM